MIIMVESSLYYFTYDNEKDQGETDILKGLKYTYVNHFGSIALGSLIIPFMKIFKWTILAFA
jgi:hypothetical protein